MKKKSRKNILATVLCECFILRPTWSVFKRVFFSRSSWYAFSKGVLKSWYHRLLFILRHIKGYITCHHCLHSSNLVHARGLTFLQAVLKGCSMAPSSSSTNCLAPAPVSHRRKQVLVNKICWMFLDNSIRRGTSSILIGLSGLNTQRTCDISNKYV